MCKKKRGKIMKKFEITYSVRELVKGEGFVAVEKKYSAYAENEFEAGVIFGRWAASWGHRVSDYKVSNVQELEPCKVQYTRWTGEREETVVTNCFGSIDDCKNIIGGGMNTFDFKIVG